MEADHEGLRRRRLTGPPGADWMFSSKGGESLARNLFSMKDRVVLVTGSSRGIGRSIAEEMAHAGAKVVISSRKIDACNQVRDRLRAEGAESIAVACNVGRKEELEGLVRATLEAFGRIDCVVANTGINPVFGPLKDLSDEAWDKVMATNVRSAWWLANLTMPEMAHGGGGSFIIVSSIAALRAAPGQGAYAISKAALSHLAVNLASEWGHANIRVNAIAPGLIKTDFARRLWEDESIGWQELHCADWGNRMTSAESPSFLPRTPAGTSPAR
jgi:dehydrogenase/reductase SDR family member 4